MNPELFETMLLRLRSERARNEHVISLKVGRARTLIETKQELEGRLDAITSERDRLIKKLQSINEELQSMVGEDT